MAPVTRASTRAQKMAIVYGILSFAAIIMILQLWLLTATMDAFLGGDDAVVLPALGASAVCFLLNLGLLRSLIGKRA